MFRRLRSFISLNARNSSSKRLLHAKPQQLLAKPAMLDIVQEIAVYIHRFHNLDLFQQGWYQIKISMRWEDDSHNFSPGTPSRVVQYEAPDVGSFDSFGVWRINDVDHSFSTQPFRIKYARQDVLLSVMISFNFALDKFEIPSTSAVILKFELLHSPTSEPRSEFQASLDASPASVHEFRIPPKALMGLHSYCPVHFDAFHAVLVDLSIHVVLLKAGTYRPLEKVSSESCAAHDVSGNHYEGQDQSPDQGSSEDSKEIASIKALITARDILVKEVHKLGKGIDQTIGNLIDSNSIFEGNNLIDSYLRPTFSNTDTEVPDKIAGGTVLASESRNGLEKSEGIVDFRIDGVLHSLPKEDLLDVCNYLGNQLSSIWNAFLSFHRDISWIYGLFGINYF